MDSPIMFYTLREETKDEYSWLDNDEAKDFLRQLFNRGSESQDDLTYLCASVQEIYNSVVQIRDEMVASYNRILACIDVIKKYVPEEELANALSSININNNLNGFKSINKVNTIRTVTQTSETLSLVIGSDVTEAEKSDETESTFEFTEHPLDNEKDYNFPLASCVRVNCLLKIVVNHAVAGLYIGKNGAHLKMLQSKYQFKLTQSGRGAKGDFTGVGYPCHRTNTTLLFQGNLVEILYGLRPLYKIIQSDLLALDEESNEFLCGRTLKVKFELNLVVPADRKRILLQGTGKRCTQLRNASGVEIIAGKQNFEIGNIKESIVTLFGFEENVERAMEWLGIFLQESPAIASGDYFFMDYPKYTTAIPESTRQ